ncbi:MAG: LemA family protein [Rhodocyclaceae bacterium]|nr:LemA family protein [Rhodocyclaceae bacterium]
MLTTESILLLVFVLALLGYGLLIYRRLVSLRKQSQHAYALVDLHLQHRYGLVAKIVEAARQHLAQEQELPENVLSARTQAQTAARTVAMDPANSGALAFLAGAEHLLQGALAQLFARLQSAPQWQADEQAAQLRQNLASTDEAIRAAQQAFNDVVMRYNARCEAFPDALVAGRFGFETASLLVLTDVQTSAPASAGSA